MDYLGLSKIITVGITIGKMAKFPRADRVGHYGLRSSDRMRNYKMSCREINSILFSGGSRAGQQTLLTKFPLYRIYTVRSTFAACDLRDGWKKIPVRSRLLEVTGRSKTEN